MDYLTNDAILSDVLDHPVRVARIEPATGGCINETALVYLDDGQRLFIKTHRNGTHAGMYAAEYRALELLAVPGTLQVPRPLAWTEDCLVLEAFMEGRPAVDWQAQMGRGLAQLHQATQGRRFGFACDNYIGTTPQPNRWQDDWPGFWRERRLGHQLTLLRRSIAADDPLLAACERLAAQLDGILAAEPEPAVLLHGDLWSGNAAANEKGRPVIFDPASYYGHREAEIGMMRLFGGFGPVCEGAYQEVWPLQPEADRRIAVYQLYHQLNHLILFGGGYYAGCMATLKSLL